MVFLHHALQVPLLWSGVDLFFILSGYLITNILLKDRENLAFGTLLKRFYVRRAERILPAYVVFLLLAFWLVRADFNHVWGYYLLFLQNVPFAFHLIGLSPLVPLWSLAVEQHFYLVWPALVYFLPRRALAPCMVAILLGEPLLRALCTPLFATPEPIYCLTPFRLDAMAAGALAALLLPGCRKLPTVRAAQMVMAAGIVLYALLAVHPWFRRDVNGVAFNTLSYSLNIAVLGGLFVWVVLSGDGLLGRVLATPVLRGLGRISYMFYLLHLLVLDETGRYMGGSLGRYGTAAAAFAITAALASVSWFAIERPILNLSASHRRGGRKIAAKPA